MAGEHLERVMRRQIDRLILAMPPRHGKTELASRRYAPFALGHFPERNFIMSSAGDELATEIGGAARDCVKSEPYQSIFPHVRLKMDSKAAGRWNTTEGGGLYAVGINTDVMGRGAHDWVIDDPFGSWKDAQSELARKTVKDWYQGTVYNRLEPDGAIIIICHRMHDDDLIGFVLEQQANGGDKWEIVELKAIAEEDDTLGREVGQALWEDKYPLPVLQRIKKNSLPATWSALYQQNPQPEDGTFFQRDWFKRYDEAEIPPTDDFGVSDYAVSDGAGDWTELGIVGIASNWDIYVRDWWSGQTPSNVWADKIIDLVERYKPFAFFGEKGVIEKATRPLIDRAMDEAQIWCDLVYLPSSENKPARARPLQGMAARGKIWLPKGENGDRILEQLLRFPMGKNDDVPDALGEIARAIEEAHPAIKAIAEGKTKRRSGWDDDDDDERTGQNWKTR